MPRQKYNILRKYERNTNSTWLFAIRRKKCRCISSIKIPNLSCFVIYVEYKKACGILGIRDREFRDCELETLREAFSRKISTATQAAHSQLMPPPLQQPPAASSSLSPAVASVDSAVVASRMAAKMKKAYKDQMKIHEAYQFLLKRRMMQVGVSWENALGRKSL